MKTYFRVIAVIFLCVWFRNSYGALDSGWDARIVSFPTPAKGKAKAILDTKLCNDEKTEYKAEIVVEKDILTDDRHEYWLNLDIQHKSIDRSSYDYYEISKIELISSKLGKAKISEEILRSVKSRPFFVDCNINKSPLIIYLPYGYSVNYRIWASPRKIKVISPVMMLRSPSESVSSR